MKVVVCTSGSLLSQNGRRVVCDRACMCRCLLILCLLRLAASARFRRVYRAIPKTALTRCTQPRQNNTTGHPTMAKTRESLQRHPGQIDILEDHIKEEEDVEKRLDESMDPLEESGHTVDSSDEEVEDAVQEDMARFEETFVGINKRFRLINRIGEGMSQIIGLHICRGQGPAHNILQEPSQQYTRLRTWSITSTRTTGTSTSVRTASGHHQATAGDPLGGHTTLPSRRYMLQAVLSASSTSLNFFTT